MKTNSAKHFIMYLVLKGKSYGHFYNQLQGIHRSTQNCLTPFSKFINATFIFNRTK